MKKLAIIIGICIGALVMAAVICRITGILNYYSAATPSNEPTLKKKAIIFGSNLKKPERFDFILYKYLNPQFGPGIYIFRLCGLPGDKVQLKNGVLFVNDRNADSSFRTYHNYIISRQDYERIRDKLNLEDDQVTFRSQDSVIIPLGKNAIKDYQITATFYNPEDFNGEIFKTYNKKWTPDNFGPLIVPDDSYFVLGDNRSDAWDSRYTGCINRNDYIATKLGSR